RAKWLAVLSRGDPGHRLTTPPGTNKAVNATVDCSLVAFEVFIEAQCPAEAPHVVNSEVRSLAPPTGASHRHTLVGGHGSAQPDRHRAATSSRHDDPAADHNRPRLPAGATQR